jgi:hypothetical protein
MARMQEVRGSSSRHPFPLSCTQPRCLLTRSGTRIPAPQRSETARRGSTLSPFRRTRGSDRKSTKERTSLHCFTPTPCTPMTLASGRLREQGIGICKDGRHRGRAEGRRSAGSRAVATRDNGEQKGIEDTRRENVCLILARTVDAIEETQHIDRLR